MSTHVDTGTRLAFERTRVAYDRTMLAWVRTAASLITFGFTIYKFFQLEGGGGERPDRLIGPREFSATLVALGLLWLVLATLEHRRDIRALEERGAEQRRSLAVMAAAVTAGLGVLALAAMAFRQ
jgi:putative membrane protein